MADDADDVLDNWEDEDADVSSQWSPYLTKSMLIYAPWLAANHMLSQLTWNMIIGPWAAYGRETETAKERKVSLSPWSGTSPCARTQFSDQSLPFIKWDYPGKQDCLIGSHGWLEIGEHACPRVWMSWNLGHSLVIRTLSCNQDALLTLVIRTLL